MKLTIDEFEERLRLVLETFRTDESFVQIPKFQIDVICEQMVEFTDELFNDRSW